MEVVEDQCARALGDAEHRSKRAHGRRSESVRPLDVDRLVTG